MTTNSSRNPVLLVHGIFINSIVFRKMSAYLRERGWSVYSFDFVQKYGTLGLDELAEQLKSYIEKTFPPEQRLNLVGLSMGGIVSRYYLQRLGGIERVERFITISSPHHGTWMAYLLPTLPCVQMRPNSQFLQDLNRDAIVLEQVNFVSTWTPWDFIIVPGSSSQLGDKTIELPVFTHACMARHPKSLETVERSLAVRV
ncbi:MAG: alpha/beta fold hydrolase [Oscillatoria sp. SIO1A7]|nr:alpha/beta fold hydrolase [Oscillatoria sp. SIO1A7]